MTHRTEIPARPFQMVYKDKRPYTVNGVQGWHRYELLVEVTDAPDGHLAWSLVRELAEDGRPDFSSGPPTAGGMIPSFAARILCGDGSPCMCHKEV